MFQIVPLKVNKIHIQTVLHWNVTEATTSIVEGGTATTTTRWKMQQDNRYSYVKIKYMPDLFLIPDCNVRTQRQMVLSPPTND